MLYCPPRYNPKPLVNVNQELMSLEGELEDEICKATLAKFFRFNLGLGVEWISGFKMTPHQEIALKGFFLRNYNLCVWGRGGSKSTIAAIACFFLPLFNPNTNIVIAGPTFRTARNIFSYMEKIEKSPEAILLKQCLGAKSKRNDLFEWEINGGLIRAIPLNGEKIRGLRANVLILDEFLLLSEDIVKNVLMPFLIAPTDLQIRERMATKEKEDALIAKGIITEEQRTKFLSTSKMICLSSASYTFEYLYRLYTEWIDKIYDSNNKDEATYFVSQLGYEAIPSYMVEKTVIEEAKRGDEVHPSFQREYCAQFVDGSDSYFSAKKMHQLTVKDGEQPTTLLKGFPDKEYILSIDPNFSQSASADHFAMAVLEINKEEQKAVLVHNYAKAGVELKKHIEYLYYLLTSFNIVLVMADNADGNFIQSANESMLFQENKLKLDFVEYDGELQGLEYIEMLKETRKKYNLNSKKICLKHVFNQPSIRRINEQLQTWINTNRIYFASKLTQDPEYENVVKKTFISLSLNGNQKMEELVTDLISDQDDLIYLVKKECSLIEIRVSPTGGQIFDLPTALKRDNSPQRSRKDSYTALMLGVEGARVYFDLMQQPEQEQVSFLVPQMFGNSTLTR